LSVRLNVNSVQPESLSWSGRKFQTAGPATENARRPNVLRRWRGTVSLQLLIVAYYVQTAREWRTEQ